MALEVRDNGSNNRVSIDPVSVARMTGSIEMIGSNNSISIGSGCYSSGHFNATLGTNCHLTIGDDCHLGHNFIHMAADSTLAIGQKTSFNGASEILMHEPSKVTIGSFCLIASDTMISTSDMHSVLDAETGARINPAKDILIENKVWVGARAVILKGCRIGAGSIIALGAIVTGDVPRQAIMAGNPARVVRTGVTWREELV